MSCTAPLTRNNQLINEVIIEVLVKFLRQGPHSPEHPKESELAGLGRTNGAAQAAEKENKHKSWSEFNRANAIMEKYFSN